MDKQIELNLISYNKLMYNFVRGYISTHVTLACWRQMTLNKRHGHIQIAEEAICRPLIIQVEGFTSKYHRQQQFTLQPFTFQILALSLFTKIQYCPFNFRLSWAKVTWSYLSNSCQIFPVFSCFNASLILFAKHSQCLNRPASSTTLTLAGMTPWLRKAMYFPKDLTSLLML